jgi:hypothetical protein
LKSLLKATSFIIVAWKGVMKFTSQMLKTSALALTAALTIAACSQNAPLDTSNAETGLNLQFDSQAIVADLGWQGVQAQTATTERHTKVLRSAIENKDLTLVALPLYRGVSKGQPFWYVVTDASKASLAKAWGVNFSAKLANAKGTAAVQKGAIWGGVLEVPATVDFKPTRIVVPGPTAFPPSSFAPGSVGQPGYSPLVALPDGTVINASHIANATGVNDKVVSINYKQRYVVLRLAEGFYEGDDVYYVSLDSSADMPAALEAVTHAPGLNAAPKAGSNELSSARSGIGIFINGQTGASNANRQGLNSALMGEGDPLNVLQTFPVTEEGVPEADYSPLWDAHLTAWTAGAISAGQNLAQTDFADIVALSASANVTAPDGAAWGATGFIVNCPVVSIDR